MQELDRVLHLSSETEETLSSETLYKGKILDCEVWDVRLPDGRTAKREIIRHHGAAAVIPVDEDGCVLLVTQFRPAMGKIMLEIPAGLKEENEKPLLCAQRELLEETGYQAAEWRELCTFIPTPGYCMEEVSLFLATGLSQAGPVHLDDDEFLHLVRIPLSELMDILDRKAESVHILSHMDGKTIVSLLYAARYLPDFAKN